MRGHSSPTTPHESVGEGFLPGFFGPGSVAAAPAWWGAGATLGSVQAGATVQAGQPSQSPGLTSLSAGFLVGLCLPLVIVGVVLVRAHRAAGRRALLHNAITAAGQRRDPVESLYLSDDQAVLSREWNTVVSRIADAEQAAIARRVDDVVSAGHDRRGSGQACSFDDLWLGVLVIDNEFNVLYANPASRALIAQGDQEGADIEFRPLRDLIPADEILSAAGDVISHRRPRAMCTIGASGSAMPDRATMFASTPN